MKSRILLRGVRNSDSDQNTGLEQNVLSISYTSTSSVRATIAPSPKYSCKPDPNDVLLQFFVSIGSRCLRCSKKAEPYNMVLCECGHFVCLACFLICCFCDKQGVKGTHLAQLEYRKGVECFNATDYVCSKSTSTQVVLEGEKFQLECVFLNQPQPQPTL